MGADEREVTPESYAKPIEIAGKSRAYGICPNEIKDLQKVLKT